MVSKPVVSAVRWRGATGKIREVLWHEAFSIQAF